MKNLYDLYCIDIPINDVKTNSLEVLKNDLFVCIKSATEDRHKYINDAIKKGASFLVVSKGSKYNVPYIKVKDSNKELEHIVNTFYSDAKKMNLIAVTGTDGKTTTASILRDLLGHDTCGYIGTNGINGKFIKTSSNNTTPVLETTYKYLDKFYKEGLKYAQQYIPDLIISDGMLYNRLKNLSFKIGIFTNFTEDHLNVHKTIKNYLKCKRKVFNKIDKDGYAVLNMDDPYYKKIRRSSKGKVLTYGKNKYSTLRILSISEYNFKTRIIYRYNKEKYIVDSPLLGEFNVYNLSASILALLAINYNFNEIRKRILKIKVPMGRCEFLNYNTNYKILIDYAHTENGIKNILTYLNKIKKNRIITVVGSAGGREKEKRKKMGEVSQKLSDLVIYTMDDPRYENVIDIINDLIDKRKSNYIIEQNRKKAINKALSIAKKDDIVAILGKGRDNYMAIKDKKIFYSDILVLDDYFK